MNINQFWITWLGSIIPIVGKVKRWISYHVKYKWGLVYFEIDLNKLICEEDSYCSDYEIGLITANDLSRIKEDLFSLIPDADVGDKAEILKIRQNNILCFVAKQNGRILHYTLVYPEALISPLMRTPIDKQLIQRDHVYLGKAFTAPGARGDWIHLHVLIFILKHLKIKLGKTRAFTVVHQDTLGALDYFLRLGFSEVYRRKRPAIYGIFNIIPNL